MNGVAIAGATSSSYTISNAQASNEGSYSVKVINGGGSVTSSKAILTVDIPAGITTQPLSQAVVQSQSASFSVVASGTAPFSYQWNFNDAAMSGDTNASLTLTNVQTTQAGSYTVVVTNSWGSVTSTVAALTVYVPPGIETQPNNLTVTQGQNASFSVVANGSVPLSYQWNFDGTAMSRDTNASLTLTDVQAAQAGSYTVVVANPAGSITSQVATLSVDVPAGITTQPQSQTVVQSHNASFSVVASGTAPFHYQWDFNGAAMAAATNATLSLTNVQTTQAGSYTVVVANSWGSVTSTVASLTVDVPPTITTQPQSQAVAVGQDVSLSVVASGTAPFTYQWYYNGSSIGVWAQNSTLTLYDVPTWYAGNYTVVVANTAGSVTSVVAALTVDYPPGIQTQPFNQTVTQGQNASFAVVANGSAPFSYQWSFDGTAMSGATNASLALTNVQAAQAGSYTVVVANPVGSVTSQVAALIVNVPPSITTQPQSQWVTPGQNVSFSVVAGGTPTLSYQWYLNGSSLGWAARSATLTVNNIGTNNIGSYTVVVNNNWGSATSAVATLAFMVPPEITTQPLSQTVILGQNATFSVIASSEGPPSYQWSLNGIAVAAATNATLSLTNVQTAFAGSYRVVVTNNAGSITSAVATLTVLVPPGILTQPNNLTVTQGQNASFSVVASGSAPFSYQWNFNGTVMSGDTNASLTLTNVPAAQSGSYAVVVANPAGSITSQVVTLTVNIPAGITTQPQSQAVVQSQNASFSVVASGTAPFGYQWNFNGTAMSGDTNATLTLTNVQPAQTGSYTVVVANSWGSVTSAVVSLTVYVPPAITTQPQSQSVIQGQNASLSVAASGTASLSYQWYFNGSSLGGGGNSSTLTLNDLGTNNGGNYTVVVNNNWGSVTSSVATVTVLVPAGITTQPQSQAIVQGQNASFSVVANGSAPLNYQWNFDGTAMSGDTNASLTLTNVQPAQAGSYTVVVTNSAGSTTSQVATLTVDVPAGIMTQPQSQAVVQSQTASFSVVASGTAPFGYQWNFDGTAMSGDTNATLTLTNVQPAQAGSYTVVVANSWGSVTSAVVSLTVYVPPAITTQPQSQTVIQGQNASLSVAASGTASLSYQWYFNGSSLGGGGNNSTLTLNDMGTNNGGNYTVVVNNNWGAVTSAVAAVTVLVPAGITTQPQSQAVVQGQIASFSVAANGSAPLNYQWNFDGTAMSGDTNSWLTLTNVQPAQAGSYTVVVTNNAGSITSQVATLTVIIPPGITAQPQSQTVGQSQNASFLVVANGSAPFSYQWNLNGSTVAAATNATLTFTNVQPAQAGSYTVVVTNIAGSITSAPAILTVTNPVVALSLPGGGGLNSNGFTIQLSLPVGITYVILASSNLQAWTPIATNVATNGSVVFTDPAATNVGNQFYRAIVP
jgi:hypothetical protein